MRAALAALCLLTVGCGGVQKAYPLRKKALRDFERGDHSACVGNAVRAILFAERDLSDLAQDKSVAAWMLGETLHIRAHCLRALQRTPEAIADLDKAGKYLNEVCLRGDFFSKSVREKHCQAAADDMETLAKWKKELAVKEKP